MQHWNEVLDIPILNVSYEALIADQAGVTHNLLDFLELEWDEACLRFHENKRIVNTLSYNQVRQPIHSRSIGRWKLYDCYLKPLKASLLDAIPGQNDLRLAEFQNHQAEYDGIIHKKANSNIGIHTGQ